MRSANDKGRIQIKSKSNVDAREIPQLHLTRLNCTSTVGVGGRDAIGKTAQRGLRLYDVVIGTWQLKVPLLTVFVGEVDQGASKCGPTMS